VVIVEVPPDSMLGQMFAGDNRILLLAHGIVKAGLDLKRMQPDDIRISGKSITIRLPEARITDAYLDDKQTRVIERKTGFLRSFDKDLEQNVRQNAVDDIKRAARQYGIEKDAGERARLQLQNLFLQLGFQKVDFISGTPAP
jgi:ethanolamine utilization protein EutQ (cupin superfamily)